MGHHVGHWRQKGRTPRQARVERLRHRLAVETDAAKREAIEAQLAYFSRRRGAPPTHRPPP
jgi:hypothetical protein